MVLVHVVAGQDPGLSAIGVHQQRPALDVDDVRGALALEAEPAVRHTHRDGEPFPIGLMAEDEILVCPGVFGLRGEALRDIADQFLFCHVRAASDFKKIILPTA